MCVDTHLTGVALHMVVLAVAGYHPHVLLLPGGHDGIAAPQHNPGRDGKTSHGYLAHRGAYLVL